MTRRLWGQSADMAEVLRLAGALAQGELELARAEIAANLRAAVIGGAMLVIALLLLLVALNLLAAAAVTGVIAAGVPPHFAELVVAAGALLLAALLVWRGLASLSPSRLVPTRTAARLRRDAQILKEMISHDPQA